MKIVVTGGASFIGSHLVERLVKEGHKVTVIDNFSSGSPENISGVMSDVTFLFLDLRVTSVESLAECFSGSDIIYHLAADHGGRGYVELEQIACSNNFAIDNNVIQATLKTQVPKFIFASSGCMYPIELQTDSNKHIFLNETQGGPPYNPDGLYGFAKLTAELTLACAYEEYRLESTSCRFFTVYGPRAKENHAIISFIARAFIRQNPVTLWGDGTQVRNWTYVKDIVDALVLSSNLQGYNTLNIGTTERITVRDAFEQVCNLVNVFYKENYQPEVLFDTTKPTGPLNRVADNSKLLKLNGNKPLTSFTKGLAETIGWYFNTKDREEIKADFERLQISRK